MAFICQNPKWKENKAKGRENGPKLSIIYIWGPKCLSAKSWRTWLKFMEVMNVMKVKNSRTKMCKIKLKGLYVKILKGQATKRNEKEASRARRDDFYGFWKPKLRTSAPVFTPFSHSSFSFHFLFIFRRKSARIRARGGNNI